jgi:Uma2 family endonuclease
MESINLDLNKRYTYADYLTWADDLRRELLNGFIKLMSPSASRTHQKISRKLLYCFEHYLKKKKCEVYQAPSDVRLPKSQNEKSDQQIYTVVQPDLFVVCDPEKLDERGCCGAPDLIIEIVSPQNAKRDVHDKFLIYQEHGVPEYWIVFPNDQTVSVFLLNIEGKYHNSGIYAGDDKIPVTAFHGDLEIDLTEIFD